MTIRRPRTLAIITAALLKPGLMTAAPAVAAVPTISSFTPTSGKLVDIVTIYGTNFTSPATVKFNGVAANSATVTSTTRITTRVPLTASTGPISVTTSGGTATSTGVFTVNPGLYAATTTAPPGTTTKPISYSGFSPFEAIDFYLDTTDVLLSSASSTGTGSAALAIPPTTTPGVHYVTAVGRHSGYSAQLPLTVRTDWPQFGDNVAHTGANPYEHTLNTSNVDNLTEAWRSPSYSSNFQTNAPAIVGGAVYDSFIDGYVRAFDERTGALKWARSVNSSSYSSPAVSGGAVYVGADDHYLYSLNASTGAVLWRYSTGGDIESAPTVVGNVVYFGSNDGNVYALNASTGAVLWSFSTGDSVVGSPAVVGGVVYVGSLDDSVYAIDAAAGTEKWSLPLNGSILASPLVANGRVYVGSADDTMYALRASTGAVVWADATGDNITATAALVAGVLYFASDDGNAYAVTASTGASRWATSPGTSLNQAVTVENGVVFVGDVKNTYALDAEDGGVLATLDAGGYGGGSAVVDGTVTTGDSADGTLIHYTLDAAEQTSARPAAATLRPDRHLRVTRR